MESDASALIQLLQVLALSTTKTEIDNVEKVAQEIGLNLDGALESVRSSLALAKKHLSTIENIARAA